MDVSSVAQTFARNHNLRGGGGGGDNRPDGGCRIIVIRKTSDMHQFCYVRQVGPEYCLRGF